ncbi:hypothetical protein VKT23_015989, partial [Stygiomarasmius scandens]
MEHELDQNFRQVKMLVTLSNVDILQQLPFYDIGTVFTTRSTIVSDNHRHFKQLPFYCFNFTETEETKDILPLLTQLVDPTQGVL